MRKSLGCGVLALLSGCATAPPAELDNACRILEERRGWHRAALQAEQRWGVPVGTQLAVIHQESRFRANARPPRRRILRIFPGPRPSTAYGYGQVLRSTWRLYQRAEGGYGADRDDFADVVDFIGWYASRIRARTGVAPNDPYHLYLAYHEGPGGFSRGSHLKKTWLLAVARKVRLRAELYDRQYRGCAERLSRGRWWWPF